MNSCFVVFVNEQSRAPDSSKIQILPATFEEEDIGVGLFMKPGAEYHPGELITSYPGNPKWVAELGARGFIGPHEGYAFVIGPLLVKCKGNNIGRRAITWVGFDEKSVDDMSHSAHKVNTYAPKSTDPSYRKQNCCWGINISNLNLSALAKPNIQLHLVACSHIVGSDDVANPTQLLADYHWFLAYDYGQWCCDRKCELCIEGLDAYINKK